MCIEGYCLLCHISCSSVSLSSLLLVPIQEYNLWVSKELLVLHAILSIMKSHDSDHRGKKIIIPLAYCFPQATGPKLKLERKKTVIHSFDCLLPGAELFRYSYQDYKNFNFIPVHNACFKFHILEVSPRLAFFFFLIDINFFFLKCVFW